MSDAPPDAGKVQTPPRVVAGKRRARLRAIATLLVVSATLALVTYYVFRFGGALGIRGPHLLYVLLLVVVALAIRADRRRWRRLESQRVERRRGLHRLWRLPGKRAAEGHESSDAASPPSTGEARSSPVDAPTRRRRHPNRQPAAVLLHHGLIYAIIGGCVLTALYLLSHMTD